MLPLARLPGIATATVWRWTANGKLPKPVKLSERVTAWRAEDVPVDECPGQGCLVSGCYQKERAARSRSSPNQSFTNYR